MLIGISLLNLFDRSLDRGSWGGGVVCVCVYLGVIFRNICGWCFIIGMMGMKWGLVLALFCFFMGLICIVEVIGFLGFLGIVVFIV